MVSSFFKNLKSQFDKLDKKTLKAIYISNYISIFISFISIFILFYCYKFNTSRLLIFSSISLFKLGALISISAYIFGITINQYKVTHT